MSIQDMEDLKQHIEINKKKKIQQLEQVANLKIYPSRLFNSFCYDDDDDDDEEYTIAITPVLPTEDNSLSMRDEHLSTILETESNELIKSSVENLHDFDPEEEIRLVEKLLYDNSSPRPPEEFNSENSDIESSLHFLSLSFNFDVPSSLRPPAKPSDDDEIKPDMGVLTAKVVGGISKLYVHVPNDCNAPPIPRNVDTSAFHFPS
ncbi:hypothetical protein Tco_1244082 [Tanacetum coccineum]